MAPAGSSSKLPDFEAGVEYWTNTAASVDGVLGGYGHGTPVPRLDATSSRLLILSVLPELSTVTPPHKGSTDTLRTRQRKYKALDCGAGIGRVSATVLLPLFDQVDLVEPVSKFLQQAKLNAEIGSDGWKGVKQGDKSARLWLAGLQYFDPLQPALPVAGGKSQLFAAVGSTSLAWPDPATALNVGEDGYDLIMIQWCIGHLSDEQLVDFLKRSRRALRQDQDECQGYIILKENICKDEESNGAGIIFDDDDSSVTRSDKVFKRIFEQAGLSLVRRELQMGFPKELFQVMSYVLR
ncbi:hypothetical protein OIV83_001462 [Microbotryomycetes sp. JL201]|nr:hypothetical protein OIV83_001462 [Microbotryomycetes sp. JL201]